MPSAHAKSAHKSLDWPFLIVAVLAGCGILAAAVVMLGLYISHPVVDLTHDVDWGYLNHGLSRIHSFRDTASWWTGTWCGEVPFWRPLTSYVFLGMRLLWQKEYMLPREISLIILHLCFVALGGLLIWRLTGRKWLVVLALYLFAGLRPYDLLTLFGSPWAVGETLSDPKNVVELLVGIPMLISLLLLSSGRWIGALIAAVIAVCFKETGFTTWPLAVLVLAWMNRYRMLSRDRMGYLVSSVRRNWLPIAIWVAALGILAGIHYAAVGVGYNCGTNRSWPWRALCYFGGPAVVPMVTRDFSPTIASAILFLSIVLTRRRSLLPRFLIVLGALTVAILIDSMIEHVSPDVSVVRTLNYRLNLKNIIMYGLWFAIVWESRHDWQIAAFGLAACFVAAIPSWMAAQVLEHARYQATFFMEIAVAAVLLESTAAVSRRVGSFTVSRRNALKLSE